MWPWHVKMATQSLLKLLLLLMLMIRIVLVTVCCRFGSWGLVIKLNVCTDFEHTVWSRFWCWSFCFNHGLNLYFPKNVFPLLLLPFCFNVVTPYYFNLFFKYVGPVITPYTPFHPALWMYLIDWRATRRPFLSPQARNRRRQGGALLICQFWKQKPRRIKHKRSLKIRENILGNLCLFSVANFYYKTIELW